MNKFDLAKSVIRIAREIISKNFRKITKAEFYEILEEMSERKKVNSTRQRECLDFFKDNTKLGLSSSQLLELGSIACSANHRDIEGVKRVLEDNNCDDATINVILFTKGSINGNGTSTYRKFIEDDETIREIIINSDNTEISTLEKMFPLENKNNREKIREKVLEKSNSDKDRYPLDFQIAGTSEDVELVKNIYNYWKNKSESSKENKENYIKILKEIYINNDNIGGKLHEEIYKEYKKYSGDMPIKSEFFNQAMKGRYKLDLNKITNKDDFMNKFFEYVELIESNQNEQAEKNFLKMELKRLVESKNFPKDVLKEIFKNRKIPKNCTPNELYSKISSGLGNMVYERSYMNENLVDAVGKDEILKNISKNEKFVEEKSDESLSLLKKITGIDDVHEILKKSIESIGDCFSRYEKNNLSRDEINYAMKKYFTVSSISDKVAECLVKQSNISNYNAERIYKKYCNSYYADKNSIGGKIIGNLLKNDDAISRGAGEKIKNIIDEDIHSKGFSYGLVDDIYQDKDYKYEDDENKNSSNDVSYLNKIINKSDSELNKENLEKLSEYSKIILENIFDSDKKLNNLNKEYKKGNITDTDYEDNKKKITDDKENKEKKNKEIMKIFNEKVKKEKNNYKEEFEKINNRLGFAKKELSYYEFLKRDISVDESKSEEEKENFLIDINSRMEKYERDVKGITKEKKEKQKELERFEKHLMSLENDIPRMMKIKDEISAISIDKFDKRKLENENLYEKSEMIQEGYGLEEDVENYNDLLDNFLSNNKLESEDLVYLLSPENNMNDKYNIINDVHSLYSILDNKKCNSDALFLIYNKYRNNGIDNRMAFHMINNMKSIFNNFNDSGSVEDAKKFIMGMKKSVTNKNNFYELIFNNYSDWGKEMTEFVNDEFMDSSKSSNKDTNIENMKRKNILMLQRMIENKNTDFSVIEELTKDSYFIEKNGLIKSAIINRCIEALNQDKLNDNEIERIDKILKNLVKNSSYNRLNYNNYKDYYNNRKNDSEDNNSKLDVEELLNEINEDKINKNSIEELAEKIIDCKGNSIDFEYVQKGSKNKKRLKIYENRFLKIVKECIKNITDSSLIDKITEYYLKKKEELEKKGDSAELMYINRYILGEIKHNSNTSDNTTDKIHSLNKETIKKNSLDKGIITNEFLHDAPDLYDMIYDGKFNNVNKSSVIMDGGKNELLVKFRSIDDGDKIDIIENIDKSMEMKVTKKNLLKAIKKLKETDHIRNNDERERKRSNYMQSIQEAEVNYFNRFVEVLEKII